MLQLEEPYEYSCMVCLVRENLINITETDTNSIEWKSKLVHCIPEIDWNIICYLCQLCAGQLDLLYSFRNQCLTSYFSKRNALEKSKQTNYNYQVELTEIEPSCLICRETFKTQSELTEHSTIHSKSCSYCSLTLPTDAELNRHLQQVHNTHANYVCYHCSDGFIDKTDLADHIKTQHDETTLNYSCDTCDSVYATRKKLEIHKVDCCTVKSEDEDIKPELFRKKRGRKPKEKTISKCEKCGMTFSTKYLLNRHVRNVHATEKNYNCDVCDQKFASPVYLSAHKKYHSGRRPHICSFCGKGYITASDLYHHEKIHANKRAYKCEKCPKAFNTSSDLHKHRICVHIDRALWKYVCGYCNKRFPLKTNLDTHTKTHTGEKNYPCHLCDRKCINRSVLQRHIESHSNVRSFKCTHCSLEYKYQKSLDIHLAKAHGIGDAKIPERVKKYFCHICPKSYFANNKLQKHIRSHTGERPFSCHICDKRFIDKSYVKQHLKTAHNVYPLSGDRA